MKIETGIKGFAEALVSSANTADAIGSGKVAVFATPCMIGLMEEAAQSSLEAYLEQGQATVGTKLNVSHEAATPVGMKVRAESELIEVDGRRLVFKVSAYDECGLIGQGEHERFIIYLDRFMAKVNAKINMPTQAYISLGTAEWMNTYGKT